MKVKGYLLICLGTILIIVASSLFLYNLNLEKEAKGIADETIPELIREIEINQGKNSKTLQQAEHRPQTNQKPNEKYLELDSKKYLGILTIPSLGLELPILANYVYKDLMKAPCIYSGSPSEKMVIAAHNFKAHFGNIYKLSSGEPIIFTDVEGTIFRYETVLQEEVEEVDVAQKLISDWDLTLITCNYLGNRRVLVRCKKVEI